MDWFTVEMRDNRDGSHFKFDCEAESDYEAESIANDEHEHATVISVDVQDDDVPVEKASHA